MKAEIKPVTLDSEDGERTLKQHIFKANPMKRPYTREPYIGNISLCGKAYHGDESTGDCKEFELITDVEAINPDCCKLCLRELKKLKP